MNTNNHMNALQQQLQLQQQMHQLQQPQQNNMARRASYGTNNANTSNNNVTNITNAPPHPAPSSASASIPSVVPGRRPSSASITSAPAVASSSSVSHNNSGSGSGSGSGAGGVGLHDLNFQLQQQQQQRQRQQQQQQQQQHQLSFTQQQNQHGNNNVNLNNNNSNNIPLQIPPLLPAMNINSSPRQSRHNSLSLGLQQNQLQQQQQPHLSNNNQLVMNSFQLQQQQLQQFHHHQQVLNNLVSSGISVSKVNSSNQQQLQTGQVPVPPVTSSSPSSSLPQAKTTTNNNTTNNENNIVHRPHNSPSLQATLTSQQQQLLQQKKLIDQLEMQIAEHQRNMAKMNHGGGGGSGTTTATDQSADHNGNNTTSSSDNSNNNYNNMSNNNAAAAAAVVLQRQQKALQMNNFQMNAVMQQQHHHQQQQQQQQMQQHQYNNNGLNNNNLNISTDANAAALRRLSSLSQNSTTQHHHQEQQHVHQLSLDGINTMNMNVNNMNLPQQQLQQQQQMMQQQQQQQQIMAAAAAANRASLVKPVNHLNQQLRHNNGNDQEQQQQQQLQQQQNRVNLLHSGLMNHNNNGGGSANINMNQQNNNNQQISIGSFHNINQGNISNNIGNSGRSSSNGSTTDNAKDFALLKGSFAGGWQSNNDLPERRRIIILVAKLIDKMQPMGNDHKKLPVVAKKLEECLYRMARTREEYMNADTLRKRLQKIALSIGPKLDEKSKVSSSRSIQKIQQQHHLINQKLSAEAQQRINQLRSKNQQLERSMDNHGMSNGSKRLSSAAYQSTINELQNNLIQAAAQNSSDQKKRKFNDGSHDNPSNLSEKQRKKVIRQQQQRLILLRHASKCKAGLACEIKFCAQMVKLWNHMKICRDRNCSTPHCLSSRCVLNHYKICKDENRTATCEVCAPVMEVIRYQEAEHSKSELLQQGRGDLSKKYLDRQDDRLGNPMPPAEDLDTSSLPSGLRSKREKLEKQYKLMMHLKQQQGLEMQEQIRNNVPHDSTMGIKLREKRLILQKCQEQYVSDKRLLDKLIKEYQQELVMKQKSSVKARSNSEKIDVTETSMWPIASISGNIANNDVQNTSAADGDIKSINKFDTESSGLFDVLMPKDTAKGDEDELDFEPLFGEGDFLTGKKRRFDDHQTDVFFTDDGDSAFEGMFDFPPPNEENDAHEQGRKDEGISLDMAKLKRMDSNMSLNQLNPFEALGDSNATKETKSGASTSNNVEDPSKILSTMLPLVEKILNDQYGWLFSDPVDPIELGIPDYLEIIENPMDLTLVKKRLNDGYYTNFTDAKNDVNLVFENAIQYNGEHSDVGRMAIKLKGTFTCDCRALNI